MKRKNGIFLVCLIAIIALVVTIALNQTDNQNRDTTILLDSLPAFSGEPYVVVNNNNPEFDQNDITDHSFEFYSELDMLNRCGYVIACIGKEAMPTEERGSIGQVRPSGWQTIKYDFVDGKYLYNRCHLIGYQLTGENANERNLITGTRYLNIEGMLPFENLVADYVKETGNHVMYRVTPVFKGNELVARGVQIEALSVEDDGYGVCFNIYAYNNQPGIKIDYTTGESSPVVDDSSNIDTTESAGKGYILNTNSKKFHRSSCSQALSTKTENRRYYDGGRDDLIAEGYAPARCCNPYVHLL